MINARMPDMAEIIAASDEYLVVINVANHDIIRIKAISGNRYKLRPKKLATPLPPLNLSHIGNKCPKNALVAMR
jgi:hypothetical protein